MSKKLPIGPNLYVFIGLLFIAVIGLRTISTPEIWTHLAQGRSNTPISYLEDASSVNTTHLYDKLVYSAYQIGNAPLLIVLNITGILLAFALLLQVSKKWGGPLSQGFALLICGHLIFQTIDVGPQVIMMLFIALFLYILSAPHSSKLLFAILIPAQLLWTNMHGSFLYGPLLTAIAAFQAAQNANKGNFKKKASLSAQPKQLSTLAVVLMATTMINPYFLKLHTQVLANIQSPAPAYWSSLFVEYFQVPAIKPLIMLTIILGSCGVITLKKRLPIMLTATAVYGGLLVWTSPRSAILFVAMAFPLIVLSLTAISEYIQDSLKNILGKRIRLLPKITGAAFVVLIIISIFPIINNCAYAGTGSASTFGLGIQEELYPADCESIFNHPTFPDRFVNLAADGGYIAFNYNRPCFIDYRPGRYNKDLLESLNKMMLGDKEAYDTIYDRYRPEAFVINTLSPTAAQGIFTLLARPLWKLAYFDGTTAIILQNKDKYAPLLNDTAIQNAGLEKLERARKEYAELVKKGCRGGNPAELIGSGKIFLALNRPAEAKAIFSLLLQGNERIPGAWIGLGTSQLMLKEFEEAEQSLKIATKKSPNSVQAWSNYGRVCLLLKKTEEGNQALERARKIYTQQIAEAPQEKSEETPTESEQQSLEEMSPPL
ncbi:MAG TPA: hypothetical protein VIR63_04590 [Pontiella sp.]